MSTNREGGDMRRPTRGGRSRVRTISAIFQQTAKDVSGSAEQLSNLVTSVIIPATPTQPSNVSYGYGYGDTGMEEASGFRAAASGVLATIIQLFFILSFAPVLLFAIFVILTIAIITSGTITLALGVIIASGTLLALSLLTCVLPLSAFSAMVLFLARSVVQATRAGFERVRAFFI